jgi:tRNA (guanine-N7-)-methyltransferase
MSRSLKYDIPGDDPRLFLADVAALGWDELFSKTRGVSANQGEHSVGRSGRVQNDPLDLGDPNRRRRVLEIGFGRGEFLLAMAKRLPEVDFVGIEISFKRTLKMARKVARAKLGNVRLLEARADLAMKQLFLPGGLHEIWVNFSDPWPKARHAHRRVIQPQFVADAARALEEGGVLYVATDDVRYAHQIDQILRAAPSLFNQYLPWPYLASVPGRLETGYEEQWRAVGRPLHFFAYATTPYALHAPDQRDERRDRQTARKALP